MTSKELLEQIFKCTSFGTEETSTVVKRLLTEALELAYVEGRVFESGEVRKKIKSLLNIT